MRLIYRHVTEDIKKSIPNKFGILFDGWTHQRFHLVGVFAEYMLNGVRQRDLLSICRLHDTTGESAMNHAESICAVLAMCGKSPRNVLYCVADNTSTNPSAWANFKSVSPNRVTSSRTGQLRSKAPVLIISSDARAVLNMVVQAENNSWPVSAFQTKLLFSALAPKMMRVRFASSTLACLCTERRHDLIDIVHCFNLKLTLTQLLLPVFPAFF
jgi:hypothetical protein